MARCRWAKSWTSVPLQPKVLLCRCSKMQQGGSEAEDLVWGRCDASTVEKKRRGEEEGEPSSSASTVALERQCFPHTWSVRSWRNYSRWERQLLNPLSASGRKSWADYTAKYQSVRWCHSWLQNIINVQSFPYPTDTIANRRSTPPGFNHIFFGQPTLKNVHVMIDSSTCMTYVSHIACYMRSRSLSLQAFQCMGAGSPPFHERKLLFRQQKSWESKELFTSGSLERLLKLHNCRVNFMTISGVITWNIDTFAQSDTIALHSYIYWAISELVLT